jgi:uncharacterized protein YbbK (DUF523 family)
MLLAHSEKALTRLRVPTRDHPLRVMVSGCLTGMKCGVDGTDYGLADAMRGLLSLPTVRVVPFCPEHYALGTPRTTPDIHGGDGYDVLDGAARVFDENGRDLTARMIFGAKAMWVEAHANNVELAILTDMSAACGSQVISDGCRLVEERRYRAGVGVATALLLRNAVPVVSQRDHRTLGRIRALLDPSFTIDPSAVDHHETDWYRAYFNRGE